MKLGFINKQNYRFCGTQQHHLMLEKTLYPESQCGVDCPHKEFTARISSMVRSTKTPIDTCSSIGSFLKWTMKNYGFNKTARLLTPLEKHWNFCVENFLIGWFRDSEQSLGLLVHQTFPLQTTVSGVTSKTVFILQHRGIFRCSGWITNVRSLT